jgi:restriction system protein
VSRSNTGKNLNKRWGVGAKHALYRADGKWYHHLKKFPGALFDRNGYIVFNTKEDYLSCPYLQHGETLHIPNGISSIPQYVNVKVVDNTCHKPTEEGGLSIDKNGVMVAFEMLLDEIETVIESINEDGADAFQRGDYEAVTELQDNVNKIVPFREKVKDLQKEWSQLLLKSLAQNQRTSTKPQCDDGRLPHGMRTPEDAFRQPLLEALVELGGSANIGDILKIVYEKLKDRLNKYDYQRLNSPPHEIRWRNTTKWCRNTLVKEGLLSSTSPWGIWEITEAGRLELGRIKKQ